MYVTQPPKSHSGCSLSTTELSPENFALLPHFLVLRTKGPGTQSDKTVGTIAIVYSELVLKGVARFQVRDPFTSAILQTAYVLQSLVVL